MGPALPDNVPENMPEISPAAATLLKRQVVRAYKSIPKRGAETGGLLCGALTPSIRIDSVIPVSIEHRFGPSYRLSDADNKRFAEAIASHPNVIGWYRSHTRPGNGVTDDDRTFAKQFFPADSAFLLCFPDAQYNTESFLHRWSPAAGFENAPGLKLPLGRFSLLEDALEAAAEQTAEDTRQQPPVTAAPPLIFPRFAGEAPSFTAAPAPRQLPSGVRTALFAVLAVALIAAAAFLFRGHSGQTVQANNIGLGLKVDRQGEALLLNWDRQSAAVLEAADATFTIVEGPRRKELRLSPAELHNGGILYTPQSDNDVQVELALHGPGGNFAQSLRIVQQPRAVPEAARPKPLRRRPAPEPASDTDAATPQPASVQPEATPAPTP